MQVSLLKALFLLPKKRRWMFNQSLHLVKSVLMDTFKFEHFDWYERIFYHLYNLLSCGSIGGGTRTTRDTAVRVWRRWRRDRWSECSWAPCARRACFGCSGSSARLMGRRTSGRDRQRKRTQTSDLREWPDWRQTWRATPQASSLCSLLCSFPAPSASPMTRTARRMQLYLSHTVFRIVRPFGLSAALSGVEIIPSL